MSYRTILFVERWVDRLTFDATNYFFYINIIGDTFFGFNFWNMLVVQDDRKCYNCLVPCVDSLLALCTELFFNKCYWLFLFLWITLYIAIIIVFMQSIEKQLFGDKLLLPLIFFLYLQISIGSYCENKSNYTTIVLYALPKYQTEELQAAYTNESTSFTCFDF